ncbi:MAG: hypothetical protein JO119_21540 [Acidobacteria bacterium]|nr:hypothetical protein [Acidobacteriota bacterium]
MTRHTYLRAYMAGIVVPTLFLLIGATAFCIARYVYNVPVPIERVIVFPMAVVPNLWGLWNMLFIASHARTHLSIGVHGAILPLLIGPLGIVMTSLLDFNIPGFASHILPIAAPVAFIAYYLIWKYFVSSLNHILDIA